MAMFVIVHGGWGGGWEWTAVARALRDANHEVFTPTLTGMGERAHLARKDVGVTTHVQDILAMLQLEDLHNVVLCGHSYGGMPVTGAADQVPDRIKLVVYIDALIPRHAESALDLLPEPFGDLVRSAAAGRDEVGIAIPTELLPPPGLIPEEERARYISRLHKQPITTFSEPIVLTGAVERLPRAFVRCTAGDLAAGLGGDPIARFADRAQAEGWIYRELATPHDPQLIDPTGTAAVLHELASTL